MDLNCDLAEGALHDQDLLNLVTTANICCGAHAGISELTRQTVAECLTKGVAIVAHPGYPDRPNWGRLGWEHQLLNPSEWEASLNHQLDLIPEANAIKPHGALYHDLSQARGPVEVFVRVLRERRLALVGFPLGDHRTLAAEAGVRFIAEGFADRRMLPSGWLVPRQEPDALLSDPEEIEAQTLRLLGQVETLCIHSDSPGCIEIAQACRTALTTHGHPIASLFG